jgi:hypothetical protein
MTDTIFLLVKVVINHAHVKAHDAINDYSNRRFASLPIRKT